MEQLQSLLNVLAGDYGWAAQVSAMIGTVRLPLKFVSGRLLEGFNRAVSNVAASGDADHIARVRRVLASGQYKFFAFLCDWLLSVKLPSLATIPEKPTQ